MKIGVSGASGHLGKATVAELTRRGPEHHIVAISRTPQGAGPVEARFGDYNDRTALVEAYRGLDAVMLIPVPGGSGGQFRNAIDAAIEAGVSHILLLSTTGTREVAEPSMFAAYWEGEQHLIKTAPRWNILRMNYYAESFAQTAPMSLATGALVGTGGGRVAFVSRDDVAAAAAGILLGQGQFGAIYNATGAKAFSGEERAAAISETSGKPVDFHALPEAQLRIQLQAAQVPAPYIQAMIDIENKFADGGFDLVSGDVEKLAGRRPRALEDVLAEVLSG